MSTNGGANFTTLHTWANGTDFTNDNFYPEDLIISGFTLTDQTQIRFRCDASGDGDDVYIDEVRISTPVTTVSFTPTDDSYSRQDHAAKIKGAQTSLSVRGGATSKEKNVYLKFDVSGVTGPVQSAKLKLYVDDKAPSDATAHSVADTTWNEATMTWNNAPAIGASLETITSITPLNWTEWDVTSHVTGDGLISLAVSSTDDRTVLDFHSKEFTYPPVLEVSYVDAGGNNPPDINGDGDINFEDLDYIDRYWFLPCADPNWCEGADLDLSGLVDYQDLKTFTQSWDGLP
jgi:hypothetical protein